LNIVDKIKEVWLYSRVEHLVPYSQHFIFFVTFEWAQKCYITLGWKGLTGTNNLTYLAN